MLPKLWGESETSRAIPSHNNSVVISMHWLMILRTWFYGITNHLKWKSFMIFADGLVSATISP